MNATTEIDKSGRLVVPKKLRDALHLVPGTRISVRQEGSALLIEQERQPRALYRKNGVLVYGSGRATPPGAVDWVEQDREERLRNIAE